MKKFLVIFFVSFSLGLLFVSFIAYANQTSITNYYPSPSGNYTKVHLVNQSGASVTCNGTNGGTIFADPTTGYLEVCKNDGSVASYPGSCFTRFGAAVTSPACPSNYKEVNTTSPNFGGGGIVSWYCCFTGQGVVAGASIAKSGCFSIYATNGTPALCNSAAGDANAYDVGCDAISSSDMHGTGPVFKRNCCFNDSLGANVLGTASTCVCPNTCGASNCGTDACGHVCGTCASPEICPATTPSTCICPNTCGADNCGTDACGHVCGTCPSPESCPSSGPSMCVCLNTCGADNCGTDPCGHVCGTCASPQTCPSSGPSMCICPNTCGASNCGTDACGHLCGTCPSPDTCPASTPSTCSCSTNFCGGSNCGTDACGHVCGTCTSPQTCPTSTPGTCSCPNTCGASNCGTDACGHLCGTCPSPDVCPSSSPSTCVDCGTCVTAFQCGTNLPGTDSCGACTTSPTCTATCVSGPCPTATSCNEDNCEWTYTAAAVVDTSGYAANGNTFVAGKQVIQSNNQSWEQCGLIAPSAPVTSIISLNCDNSASSNDYWEAGDACPFIYNCAAPAADCAGTECSGTPGTLAGYSICGACNTASPIACTGTDVCDEPWGSNFCCTPPSSCPTCSTFAISCGGVTCPANCGGICGSSGDGSETTCCSVGETPCETSSEVICCDDSTSFCDTSSGSPNCTSIP